jgi:hypothetical protein
MHAVYAVSEYRVKPGSQLTRQTARRIYTASGSVGNYVMLQGLVKRFMALNPDADPETIDWSAVWDTSLSYEELVQAFREQYPMFRWTERQEPEERYTNPVKDMAAEIAAKLDLEEIDSLIHELQKIKAEVLEDTAPAADPEDDIWLDWLPPT